MMACVGGQAMPQKKSPLAFWRRGRKSRPSAFSKGPSPSPFFDDAATALRAAGSCDVGVESPTNAVSSYASMHESSSEPLLGASKSMPDRSSESSDQTCSTFEQRSSCSSTPDENASHTAPIPEANEQLETEVSHLSSPRSTPTLEPENFPVQSNTHLSIAPPEETQDPSPTSTSSTPTGPSSSRRSFQRTSRLGEAQLQAHGPGRPPIMRCATTTSCSSSVTPSMREQYRQLREASGHCSSANSGLATVPFDRTDSAPSPRSSIPPHPTDTLCNTNTSTSDRAGSPHAVGPNEGFATLFSLSRKPMDRAQNWCFPMASPRIQPCSASSQAKYLASQRRLAELSDCGSNATSPARSIGGHPLYRCQTTLASSCTSPAASWTGRKPRDAADVVPGWPLGLKKDGEGGTQSSEGGECAVCVSDLEKGSGTGHRRGQSVVENPNRVCAKWSKHDWELMVAAAEAGLRAGEASGMSKAEWEATRVLLRSLEEDHQGDPSTSRHSSSTDTSDLALLCPTDSDGSEGGSANKDLQDHPPTSPTNWQNAVTGGRGGLSMCPFKSKAMTAVGPLACPYLSAHSAESSVVERGVSAELHSPVGEAFPRHPLQGVESRAWGPGTPAHVPVPVEEEARGERLCVMEAVVEAQEMLLGGEGVGASSVCWFLLEKCLELSSATMGFIASLKHQSDGSPFLKTHAVTNIGWTPELRQWYDENRDAGVVFTNMDTLFGSVVKTREVVISETPETDSRYSGVPPGHPAITSFLGIPLFQGEELVGVCALANRQECGIGACFGVDLACKLKPLTRVAAVAVCRAVNNVEGADDRTDVDSEIDVEYSLS